MCHLSNYSIWDYFTCEYVSRMLPNTRFYLIYFRGIARKTITKHRIIIEPKLLADMAVHLKKMFRMKNAYSVTFEILHQMKNWLPSICLYGCSKEKGNEFRWFTFSLEWDTFHRTFVNVDVFFRNMFSADNELLWIFAILCIHTRKWWISFEIFL